ncbi:MAG: hypothetical protein WCA10_19475 [Terracidiphilus sp.]
MAALAHPISTLHLPQTALPQQEPDPRVSNTADEAEYLERLHTHVYEMIKSLRLSQIKALDSDFAPFAKQLDGLCNLAEGWDGYDAPKPSPQAIKVARTILERMQEELVKPYWISASADGGVAFSFMAPGDRRAQIEVLNNGEKFAHLYDLNGDSHTEDWTENLEQKPFRELLEPILNYIQL